MPSIKQICVAAALLSLGATNPIDKRNTFSVGQKLVNEGYLTAGPILMARTYTKFGKKMPADVAAAASTSDGTVAADPTQYDSEYIESVQIGTPAQTLNLDFDTGSSDL